MAKLGPYDLNQIYCGECSEMMSQLPDDCIDLTVTSPPYDNLRDYEGFTFDFEAIARQLWRVTKPGGVVVWVVGDAMIDGSETGTSFRQALGFMDIGFKLHDTMIYYRNSMPSVAILQKRYEQHFEYMFIFSKNTPKVCNHLREKKISIDRRKIFTQHRIGDERSFRKNRTVNQNDTKIRGNVWRMLAGGGHHTKDKFAHNHPAIFPEDLAHDHIISWSNPGDIILDPMIGSGTVAKMAMQTGRHYLGFDISEKYCELARKRVAQVQLPLFIPKDGQEVMAGSALI